MRASKNQVSCLIFNTIETWSKTMFVKWPPSLMSSHHITMLLQKKKSQGNITRIWNFEAIFHKADWCIGFMHTKQFSLMALPNLHIPSDTKWVCQRPHLDVSNWQEITLLHVWMSLKEHLLCLQFPLHLLNPSWHNHLQGCGALVYLITWICKLA